ncbi:MAG: nicotinate-nucleotide--dimethylbenzimidazole phosphoribosyltransferase [Desulfatirhabdiaceae bacterium]
MKPDLKQIVDRIEPVNPEWIQKAQARTAQLAMPPRALGALHDISERLCGILKTLTPSVAKKAVVIMAGDHGIVAEGISAFPQQVTGAMVQTFLVGGAGINALSRQVGADVCVVDMGIIPEFQPDQLKGGEKLMIRKIRKGTHNFLKGPAMSRDEAKASILSGFEAAAQLFENGLDILGTGDMGIGNTTPSAAIGTVLTGADLADMTGPGTGLNAAGVIHKQHILKTAISHNRPDPKDGLDVLSKIGGFEIGGIAGLILAAAAYQKPVVIDGFISTAGALIAHALCPNVLDYIFSGHCSEEPGHRLMLDYLKLTPILNLGMRLGEGTGAVLAMGIMDAAVQMFRHVLTFEEAGVAGKER